MTKSIKEYTKEEIKNASQKEEIVRFIEQVKIGNPYGYSNKVIQCLVDKVTPKNDLMHYGKAMVDSAMIGGSVVIGLFGGFIFVPIVNSLMGKDVETKTVFADGHYREIETCSNLKVFMVALFTIVGGYLAYEHATNNIAESDLTILKSDILECLGVNDDH